MTTRHRLLPICAALITTVSCLPAHADKITRDPNAAGASQSVVEATNDTADERMAQRVTYTAAGKRLHTVLEELSKQTHVSISAGKNTADWQVRDLPVVVCVKDMPLGKLIRTIAEATHLAMSTSTVGKVKRYRIWRDPEHQKQLDDYFAQIDDGKARLMAQQWDSWLKISKMSQPELEKAMEHRGVEPPIEFHVGDAVYQRQMPNSSPVLIKRLAAVMAALPDGSRESVLGGKPLSLSVKTASPQLASSLKALYKAVWDFARHNREAELLETEDGELYSPPSMGELTEDIINSTVLRIGGQSEFSQLLDYSGHVFKTFEISLESSSSKGHEMVGGMPSGGAAYGLVDHESVDISEPPQTGWSADLHEYGTDDAKHPALNVKFKALKPSDPEHVTYADLAVLVANASGFSIVCEDFRSHTSETKLGLLPICFKETTLKQLFGGAVPEEESGTDTKQGSDELPEFSMDVPFWREEMHYLIAPDSRLIMGWNGTWYDRHRALAPEKLITSLVAKANGDGIEIDDAVRILTLSPEQRSDWVFHHKDLFRWELLPQYEPFWRLYASLSGDEKTLAKSSDGVPLAMLDHNAVLAAFKESAESMEEMGHTAKMDAIGVAVMSDPTYEEKIEQWAKEQYPQVANEDSGTSEEAVDMNEMINALFERFPELRASVEIPTDSQKILNLKIRLHKDGSPGTAKMTSAGARASFLPELHTYHLSFEGGSIKMRIGLTDSLFPIYSGRRRVELAEEARKSSGKPEQQDESGDRAADPGRR